MSKEKILEIIGEWEGEMKKETIDHLREQAKKMDVSYDDFELWLENDCTQDEREDCSAGTCLPKRCHMIEKWRNNGKNKKILRQKNR